MSTLLITASKAEAQAAADKAHAWRIANIPRYSATKWADPIQNAKDGTWAVAFEPSLLPGFTATELGTTTTKDAQNKDVITYTKAVPWTDDFKAPPPPTK